MSLKDLLNYLQYFMQMKITNTTWYNNNIRSRWTYINGYL